MSYIGTTKIGKMFLGNTEIAKAYLGSHLVYQAGTQPQPGTQIPYIRGGADGSYIDTGITPDNTTQVVVWARNWNPESGTIFGARTAYGNSQFAIGAHGGVNVGGIRIDYSQGNLLVQDAEKYLSHYHKYELYGGVLKVDDVVVGSVTDTTFNSPNNIYIFCLNNNGTVSGTTKPIDICACKIYKNGVLVRDFTAVNSPSVGLFDAVSQTLFTNSGGGAFTYNTFDPSAYTPLEYISATHAQCFNTGIKGSNTLPFCVVFMNDLTSNVWPTLFGAQTSGSSTRYGIAFGYTNNLYKQIYFLLGNKNKSYTSSTALVNKKYAVVKNSANVFYLYNNGAQVTTQTVTNSTFTTVDNIYMGTLVSAGTTPTTGTFSGKFYYASLGDQRNFVPGKVDNVVGMYDTYNDRFYPSETETPFIEGPTI